MTSTAASPAIAAAPAQPITPGVTSSIPGAQAPPADFLLMLGQLIGASAAPITAPALAIEGAIAPAASDEGETTADEEAMESVVLGIAPLITTAAPIAPAPIAPSTLFTAERDTGGVDDIVAELKLAREPAGRDASAILINAEALNELSAQSTAALDAKGPAVEALHATAAPVEAASSRPITHDAPISRPVHAPVGSQQWADEIGARLTMMADAGKQTASLRLTPEHLGPLEIRIAINDDQASVWFGAAHADTRAAIEHALPRLRELFEASGMSLADAGVHQESPKGDAANNSLLRDSALESVAEESRTSLAVAVKVGLVDAYA